MLESCNQVVVGARAIVKVKRQTWWSPMRHVKRHSNWDPERNLKQEETRFLLYLDVCVCVFGEGVEPIKQSNRAAKEDQSKGTKAKQNPNQKAKQTGALLSPNTQRSTCCLGLAAIFKWLVIRRTNTETERETEKESERERYRQSEPKER